MNQQRCCEKCLIKVGGGHKKGDHSDDFKDTEPCYCDVGRCGNGHCPCHTQTTPSHEGKEFAGASYVSEKRCTCTGKLHDPDCGAYANIDFETAPQQSSEVRYHKANCDFFRNKDKCNCDHPLLRERPQQSSGIEEIVQEYRKQLGFPDNWPQQKSLLEDWLRDTLTSFESRIRAEEMARYMSPIMMTATEVGIQMRADEALNRAKESLRNEGAAQELTRIADLIEERLGRIERLRRNGGMLTGGQMDMARATLEELRDTTLNLIRGK